jgi:hypothetical protein
VAAKERAPERERTFRDGREDSLTFSLSPPAPRPFPINLSPLYLSHTQDFSVAAMRTCRLSVTEAALLGAPALAGRAVVATWLHRSNAVLHLRAVLQQSSEEGNGEDRKTACTHTHTYIYIY